MKNKKNIVLGLLIMTALTLGVTDLVRANTYQFINTSGELKSFTANSSDEALRTAYQLAVHSGVRLVSDNNVNNDFVVDNNNVVYGQGSNLYQYINTSGELSTVRANTPEEAIRTAYQLGAHSGVMTYR